MVIKMRLIDADALEGLFRDTIGCIAKQPKITKDLEHMIRASAMTIEMIADAPTIDSVPVVHGHWELARELDTFTSVFRCSKCKYEDVRSYHADVPFCWHCGAKMDEQKDGEQDD